MNIVRVGYIFATTLVGLLLLSQQSISIYWQQTYHQDLPIASLQKHPFFSSLIHLNQQLLNEEDRYFTQVKHFNEQMFEQVNHLIVGEEVISDNDAYFDNHVQNEVVPADAKQSTAVDQHNTLVNDKNMNDHDVANNSVDDHTIKPEKPASIQQQNQSTPDEATVNVTSQPDPSRVDGEAKPKDGAPISDDEVTDTIQPIVINDKDKILFIGDSLMQGVAPRVKRALYQKYRIESLDLSKQSTGLSYPSVLNWPKTVEETLAQEPLIKVLVVFLGPNDPWDYPVRGQSKYLKFKSSQWEATYRYRINRILAAARLNQAQVIWLGAPCMRKTTLHNNMVYLNSLYSSEVAKMREHYISTSELLGCDDDGYANFVTTSKGNVKVRIDDGIHFTVPGQRIIAQRIIDEIAIKPLNQNKATQ